LEQKERFPLMWIESYGNSNQRKDGWIRQKKMRRDFQQFKKQLAQMEQNGESENDTH